MEGLGVTFFWLFVFFQDTPPYVALAGLKLKRSSRLSLPTVMAKRCAQPHPTSQYILKNKRKVLFGGAERWRDVVLSLVL